MSKWPKDDKLMHLDDLVTPVYKTLKKAYTFVPKDYGESIEWIGPDLPRSMGATCLPFNERLTKKQLKYYEENQGRDPLEVIIGIAVQLGIEQGRRTNKDGMSLKIVISSLEFVLSYLKRQ